MVVNGYNWTVHMHTYRWVANTPMPAGVVEDATQEWTTVVADYTLYDDLGGMDHREEENTRMRFGYHSHLYE
jgi:hypothetical protein